MTRTFSNSSFLFLSIVLISQNQNQNQNQHQQQKETNQIKNDACFELLLFLPSSLIQYGPPLTATSLLSEWSKSVLYSRPNSRLSVCRVVRCQDYTCFWSRLRLPEMGWPKPSRALTNIHAHIRVLYSSPERQKSGVLYGLDRWELTIAETPAYGEPPQAWWCYTTLRYRHEQTVGWIIVRANNEEKTIYIYHENSSLVS